MTVSRIVAGHIDDGVIGAEPRQGINMGVSIIPFQVAMLKPEHLLCAEQGLHRPFQFLTGQLRVAVGGKQALAGGHNRAAAVALNAATFKHQTDDIGSGQQCPLLLQLLGDLVVQISGKFQAPAVEAEVKQHRLVIHLHRNRAEIPGPCVVGGNRTDSNAGQIHPGTGKMVSCRIRVRCHQQYFFKADDLADQLGISSADLW